MARNWNRLRVLVAEDCLPMSRCLSLMLEAFGITKITLTTDGSHALTLLGQCGPHLILTDWSMAPIDGLTLTREIRHAPPPRCHLPIVMISGHGDAERMAAARSAGVTEYMVKPVTPRGLFVRLTEVIAHVPALPALPALPAVHRHG